MSDVIGFSLAEDTLPDDDFERLATLIEDYSGIRMPEVKRTMVEGRLRRRVRDLGLADLRAYCRFIFEEGGLAAEFVQLIDAITTNKTDFFREPVHFQFLTETVVPQALRDHPTRPLRMWSAACSIGAEPYSAAMVLDDYSRRIRRFRFEIVATDISSEVLRTAISGVFDEEMIHPIPDEYRGRYLMRARDPSRRVVRVVPELRAAIRFGRVNLMDATYPVPSDMDVIFCRNILIYFDRATQMKVLERLTRHLRPGGHLVLGHSETLTGMALPLRQVSPTVFRND